MTLDNDMATSEAQKRACTKWRANNQDRIKELRAIHKERHNELRKAHREAGGKKHRGNLTDEERRARYLESKARYNAKVRGARVYKIKLTEEEKKAKRAEYDRVRYELKKIESNYEPKKMGRPRGEPITVMTVSSKVEHRGYTPNEKAMIEAFLAKRSA